MKLLNLLIICLYIVNLSCAQTPTTIKQNQIAVINTSLFYDERVGIIPLLAALRPLYTEFKSEQDEINRMIKKRQELSAEISKLQSLQNVNKETIDRKTNEYENLNCKIKGRTEETKTLFAKREKEVTKELNNDIAESIKQFAMERGYIIVLDNVDRLIFEDTIDVTTEFTKFYNMSPKKK